LRKFVASETVKYFESVVSEFIFYVSNSIC